MSFGSRFSFVKSTAFCTNFNSEKSQYVYKSFTFHETRYQYMKALRKNDNCFNLVNCQIVSFCLICTSDSNYLSEFKIAMSKQQSNSCSCEKIMTYHYNEYNTPVLFLLVKRLACIFFLIFFPICKLLSKDLRNSPFQFLSNKFFSEKLKSLFLYRQNWFI